MYSTNRDSASEPDFLDICEDFFINLRRDIIRSITGLPLYAKSQISAPFEMFDGLSLTSQKRLSLLDIVAPQWEYVATRTTFRDIFEDLKFMPGFRMGGFLRTPFGWPIISGDLFPDRLDKNFEESIWRTSDDRNKMLHRASFRSTSRTLQSDGSYLTRVVTKKVDSNGMEDVSEEEFIEPAESTPLVDDFSVV